MKGKNQHYIGKAEFYGALLAIFSFLFVIHMTPTIIFRWFFDYITAVIIVVQLICLYCFLKHVGLAK